MSIFAKKDSADNRDSETARPFRKRNLTVGLNMLPMRIRIVLQSMLGLVVVFVFMAWLGMSGMEAVTRTALEERMDLARSLAVHMEHELVRSLDRLEQVAAFSTIDLEDGNLEPERHELKALYRPTIFKYVFITDKDGNVTIQI